MGVAWEYYCKIITCIIPMVLFISRSETLEILSEPKKTLFLMSR